MHPTALVATDSRGDILMTELAAVVVDAKKIMRPRGVG
jgi:hypothetical protein